jgi:ABC-2 type transport system permease protein
MLTEPLKSLTRVSSFIGKELRELIRRPWAVVSLILGPFLIMAIFGAGYTGIRKPFQAVVVIPPESGLPTDVEYYESLGQGRIEIVEIVADEADARGRLERREIGLLVIAPVNAPALLQRGEQSPVQIVWNEVDPVQNDIANLAVYIMVKELNREIIERVAEAGLARIEQEAGEEVPPVPPEIIASPVTAQTDNIAPTEPQVVKFFGPAVFALVMQHLAVTLSALSMIRERLSGAFDIFRVSPTSPIELLIGKYLAYGFMSLLISGGIAVLLTTVLGVPLLGGWLAFAGLILLLTFASLGLGLVISLVSDSERQAVQLSMLVLLASVFFSGFVLPVEEFVPQVRPLAYALPVTHGIRLLQDLMLRGTTTETWQVWALAGLGAAFFVVAWVAVRAMMAPRR